MRIRLRLTLSLILGITLVAFLFAMAQVKVEQRGLKNDLERRAEILAESLSGNIEPLLGHEPSAKLLSLVERFGNRERLAGVAVYDGHGRVLAITPGLVDHLKTFSIPLPPQSLEGRGGFFDSGNRRLHVYALPLYREGDFLGTLALFHDATFIDTRKAQIWREAFMHVLVQAFLIALATVLIIRWSFVGPIARTTAWIRSLRTRGTSPPVQLTDEGLFQPLIHEVTHMAKSLSAARAAATEEARLREASESTWTPERLKVHVQSKLHKSRLLVVSNREPYLHVHAGKEIKVIVPASGLVTAIEPILRACAGTWVAQGSGDADREMVDANDRLRVPPQEPQYTLRRVWLTPEEEEGYYFGFANEGLWPLCHIAHMRPEFRAADWEQYRAVNEKFAQAVLQELKGEENPAVLVQDYHFALLPRLIKEQRPDARIALFWHIPWPNPEAFGICPWQRELLDGLLGADLLGFHIQSHCNNFLETVDSALESRIEWESFAVSRREHLTLVRPFPISVALNDAPVETSPSESPETLRATLLKNLGVQADHLGVGVDRVDYTKGILERFRGIETFLTKYPAYRGKFTFVQIGAPSRTRIKRYHDLLVEVGAEADRINWSLQTDTWKPIIFLKRHHSHQEIEPYYRSADLCLVTSLHDGMNLVAKEYVASRFDERGVLILSQFTGACRELRDALVVNPYDIEQLAEAIRKALEMDAEEKRARMQRMRRIVREQNIYRWAANLISELVEIRLEQPPAPLLPAAISDLEPRFDQEHPGQIV